MSLIVKKSDILNPIISLYAIILFSAPIFLSTFPLITGYDMSDNIIYTSYKVAIYGLTILCVIIIIGDNSLRQLWVNKWFIAILIFYLYYIYVIQVDMFHTVKAGVIIDYNTKMSILTRMQRNVLWPLIAILVLNYKKLNHIIIVKSIVFVYFLCLVFAMVLLNIGLGGINTDERLGLEEGFNSLNLGYWAMTAFLLNLYIIFNSDKSKFIYKFIFIPFFLYIVLASGSRGPIIYLVLSILFYLWYSGYFKKIKRKIRTLLIGLALLIIIGYRVILELIGTINPLLSERLLSLVEESDTSGRDGAYEIAINQFLSSPIWGDYFVLTSGPLVGAYPHNIILESLMTLGLVGSIPLFYLFYKTFIKGIWLLKNNNQQEWIFLLFLSMFFKGMTTWNLYGADVLWIAMVVLLTIDTKSIKRRIK